MDLPRAQWWPILYLGVLPRRPARSARLYKKVWTAEGSPLAVITHAQAADLACKTALQPRHIPVAVGMRYGHPSIATAVDELMAAGCDRLIALPDVSAVRGRDDRLEPGTAFQDTRSGDASCPRCALCRRISTLPNTSPLSPSLCVTRSARGRRTTSSSAFTACRNASPISAIPIPIIATRPPVRWRPAMHWPADRVTVSFQSLFGREEWLRPYTDETLRRLAARRIPRLAVVCPGFTADCLETLEEMGMTNRELYEAAGGGEYRLVPCLNTHPAWIEAMAAIVRRELRGWDPSADLRTTGPRRPARLEPRSHALPRQEDEQAVVPRRSLPADPPPAGQSRRRRRWPRASDCA